MIPPGIYHLEVNNKNTAAMYEKCSPAIFIFNFEHISHLALVLTLVFLVSR